jgi:hypothetical protein
MIIWYGPSHDDDSEPVTSKVTSQFLESSCIESQMTDYSEFCDFPQSFLEIAV